MCRIEAAAQQADADRAAVAEAGQAGGSLLARRGVRH